MPKVLFSNEDYLNLMIIYGQCNKVIARTVRTFQERFPNRPRPTKDTVTRVLKNLGEHGTFRITKIKKTKPISDNDVTQINVLAYFTANPTASLSEALRDIGVGRSSIWNILNKFKFHPYLYLPVQHLKDQDYLKRVQFCETLVIKIQEDEHFLDKIMWSDEAKITKNGLFNRHNSHFWSDSNLHVIREGKFQETWSFNVYCAIKNDSVVVVHIYDENLTGIFVSNLL